MKTIDYENFSVRDFRQLKVWQKSVELCDHVYTLAFQFGEHEKYNLRSQIIRSSSSISSCISEGNAQGLLFPKKEISFLSIAIGSAQETLNHAILAHRYGYIHDADLECIEEYINEITRMLVGKIRSIGREMKKEAQS